ncbi:MAG: DUF1194 domain-containing protein [Alphaproteobacteria bacterium]|nr:MAG: DUF1194 domain-containing protein [Alphaproteobacteria bacterium]
MGVKRAIRQRILLAFAFLLVTLLPFARPAEAQEQVDVELVLLADASMSIDAAELRFQRLGYAEALQHPDVLSAIAKGAVGKIAVTFIEWADDLSQDIVVPWMVVDGAAPARRFAQLLLAAPRKAFGSNAIGEAIAAAQRAIESNRYEGLRKIIDFSGDSANNWHGRPVAQARANALADGIIINGLAVLCRAQNCTGRPVGYDLEAAFARQIIGGPGSFVITADDKNSFAEAVRRKLILELAGSNSPQPG